MRSAAFFIGALLAGGVCGVAIFGYVYSPDEHTPSVASMLKFNGTVAMHDLSRRQIVVTVPDSFSEHGTKQARFSYDDDTNWWSSEYQFENTILARRSITEEQERTLPEGTVVSIFRDHASDDFRAATILFLRRSNL